MATKTETQVSELKINILSESDYNTALANGEINENELYLTPSSETGVPAGGSSGQILGWKSNGKAKWCNNVSDLVVSGAFSQNRKADTTSGDYSHTECGDCVASGQYAHAEGRYSVASGVYSHAEGWSTKASTSYAHSEGYATTASGSASHAAGCGTTALNHQYAIGHYNNTSKAEAGDSSGTTGTAFIIGNGSNSSITSNACRITYAGAVIGKAAYASTGADMAEFREWLDGNPDNEDRRGYFVTMNGMNIKIAEPGDYICGIISANPSLIGNNDEAWMGRYVFDEFGAFVYEDYEETDPETGETHTYTHYKLNPDYDPTRTYEFRADRPEWDYVGLCGVINTLDDGTCEVNGFCKCGEGGVATASERGYRVLERVNDHIVKVLFYLTGEIF